jgi:hypothetical protein
MTGITENRGFEPKNIFVTDKIMIGIYKSG